MNDLKVHIERIVRPVRAMQRRKLRMRRELLTHLESAIAEERAGGLDETAAMEAAKRRLGEPAELRRSLQESVPAFERLLLFDFRAPDAVRRWEFRAAKRIYGIDQRLTMTHMALLGFGAVVGSYAALVMAVTVVSPQHIFAAQFDHPLRILLLDLAVLVEVIVSWILCSRTVVAASLPGWRWRSPRMLRLSALIAAMPVMLIVVAVATVDGRPPTVFEFGRGMMLGVGSALLMIVLGRVLARLRQPYDEWLTLEIAG